jgi:hypothetical protein
MRDVTYREALYEALREEMERDESVVLIGEDLAPGGAFGVAGDLHARVLFDTSSAWELPPLNSLLKGTVDSIRPSQIPRSAFEEAWQRDDALPLLSYEPEDAAAS